MPKKRVLAIDKEERKNKLTKMVKDTKKRIKDGAKTLESREIAQQKMKIEKWESELRLYK